MYCIDQERGNGVMSTLQMTFGETHMILDAMARKYDAL